MTLTLRPAHVAAVLLAVVTVLTLLSVASVYARFGLGHETLAGLDHVGIFHLDADVSVPGWYSASALLLAAAIVAAVAAVTFVQRRGHGWYWAVLALALCYLSVDETARLHERSAGVLVALFERDSFLTRSWTVPAAIASLLFAAAFVRFLARLEVRQRARFVAAGCLYAGSAVGLEVVGHYIVRRRLPTDEHGVVPYQAIVHAEEMGEMAAIVLLIYASLLQLESLVGTVRLRIASRPVP